MTALNCISGGMYVELFFFFSTATYDERDECISVYSVGLYWRHVAHLGLKAVFGVKY